MVKKKKSVKKSSNNFNRNLLIGVVIVILLFVFAYYAGGYDSEDGGEGLGQMFGMEDMFGGMLEIDEEEEDMDGEEELYCKSLGESCGDGIGKCCPSVIESYITECRLGKSGTKTCHNKFLFNELKVSINTETRKGNGEKIYFDAEIQGPNSILCSFPKSENQKCETTVLKGKEVALTIEIEDPNVEVVYWDTYAGSENDCPCSENPPSKSCNFNMRKPANCIAWLKDTSKINVKITSLEEGKTDTTFNSETKNCQECSFLVSTGTQFSIKPIAPEGMEFWYWGSTDYCPCEENKFKSECTFTADYTQLESLSSDIECYVAYKETMVS